MTPGAPPGRVSAAAPAAAACGFARSEVASQGREPFDLDGPMALILADGGKPLEDISLDTFGRDFDAEDDNVIVHGDVPGGAIVRGRRSVLVQGDVAGQQDAPCRIEVPGDVVVTGFVSHAHISARHIHIGASVARSQLSGTELVEITGDAERCRLQCGDYFADVGGVRSQLAELEETRLHGAELRQRVAVEGKRLHKSCRALRAPLNLNVGRIVTHGDDAIAVDLSAFYRSVEWQTDEDLDLAINEFFAKGIVGVLSRVNRKHLVEVPTRGKAFLQVMRGLHELLRQVVARDAVQRRADRCKLELERLVSELEARCPRVLVGGSIAPSARLEFILPRALRQGEDSIDFAHKTALLSIHAGAFADQLELAWQGGDGARGERTVAAGDLDGTVFQVRDERVYWERIPADALF